MGRGFFECFQQGVESTGRQHVDFVNDVDLVVRFSRHEIDFVCDPTDIVDAVIGGRVHFDHIEQGAVENAAADLALVAGIAVLGVETVDGPGENLGQRGLTGAAGAAEQIGMGDLAADDRLAQGKNRVFLLYNFIKSTGAPFTIEGQIGHGRTSGK